MAPDASAQTSSRPSKMNTTSSSRELSVPIIKRPKTGSTTSLHSLKENSMRAGKVISDFPLMEVDALATDLRLTLLSNSQKLRSLRLYSFHLWYPLCVVSLLPKTKKALESQNRHPEQPIET